MNYCISEEINFAENQKTSANQGQYQLQTNNAVDGNV